MPSEFFHRYFSSPNDDFKMMEICITMKKYFFFTQHFFPRSHCNNLYSCSRCFINSGSGSSIHPCLTKCLSAYLNSTYYKRVRPSSRGRNWIRPRGTSSLSLGLVRGPLSIAVSAVAAGLGFWPFCHWDFFLRELRCYRWSRSVLVLVRIRTPTPFWSSQALHFCLLTQTCGMSFCKFAPFLSFLY